MCYNELIPDESQPNYFLIFDVDPETIDVNIHPTKTEIKFENEQPIWQIISAAVKETLGRFSVVPSIDFDRDDAPEIPAFTLPHVNKAPDISIDKSYNPFKTDDAKRNSSVDKNVGYEKSHYGSGTLPNWEELYKNFEQAKQEGLDAFETSIPDSEDNQQMPLLLDSDEVVAVMQLNNR